MRDTAVLEDLLGTENLGFRSSKWSDDPAVFRSNPEWFQRLSSLDILCDPEQWLDRATTLFAFSLRNPLARSEARSRYLDGESIYIIGLDRTVKPLRDLCDGLAADLALNPAYVTVQAFAAGGPSSVGMHFDHEYNFNVQVAGRKQWRTAPNDLVINPVDGYRVSGGTFVNDAGRELPSEMPADATSWLAEPGDVVYVPRGTWHATCTTEPTFAIAFVVYPRTWADYLVAALRDRLHTHARWRERVMGARRITEHAQLKATSHDVISASRDILADLGPSEMLYPALWGGRPLFFKRREGIVNVRFDVLSGSLTWQLGDEHSEFLVPLWGRSAVEYMVNANRTWSLAVVHDLVSNDAVPFLIVLVKRLVAAGFLEDAPAASDGVAQLLDKRIETA